jgi:hypothetical protein
MMGGGESVEAGGGEGREGGGEGVPGMMGGGESVEAGGGDSAAGQLERQSQIAPDELQLGCC